MGEEEMVVVLRMAGTGTGEGGGDLGLAPVAVCALTILRWTMKRIVQIADHHLSGEWTWDAVVMIVVDLLVLVTVRFLETCEIERARAFSAPLKETLTIRANV